MAALSHQPCIWSSSNASLLMVPTPPHLQPLLPAGTLSLLHICLHAVVHVHLKCPVLATGKLLLDSQGGFAVVYIPGPWVAPSEALTVCSQNTLYLPLSRGSLACFRPILSASASPTRGELPEGEDWYIHHHILGAWDTATTQ